jgi:putative NADPH-quinone reductase
MQRRVLVVDGHPDKDRARFCHALAQACVAGARDAGHETRLVTLADAEFPLLRSAREFAAKPDNATVLSVREDVAWAQHIVFVFPLWIGSAPALLRGLLEQIARGDFFVASEGRGLSQRLKGRTARLVVTMGMPAFAYRLFFGAYGLKSFARSALGFAGIAPVKMTLFGGIEQQTPSLAEARLRRLRELGERAA